MSSWMHPSVVDDALRRAYGEVEELAEWSEWAPFDVGVRVAPREPGVYLFRDAGTGLILYAGRAGERAGSGRRQGLWGRLSAYRTGHGAVSGFGEAALDRALADPDWVERQLHTLRTHGPRRAKDWARDAVARLAPDISWAVASDAADATFLEDRVVPLLRPHGVGNR